MSKRPPTWRRSSPSRPTTTSWRGSASETWSSYGLEAPTEGWKVAGSGMIAGSLICLSTSKPRPCIGSSLIFAQKVVKISIFYFRDFWEFTNWDENQPSGTFEGHQQHCLSYNNYTGRAWNDATCGIPYKFLCSQKLCSGIP